LRLDAVVWRRIRWHKRAQRAILTLESTGFEYRQRRPVDLTEPPTSVHWQRPSPARSPQRAPTGLQRPMCASSCPLAPWARPLRRAHARGRRRASQRPPPCTHAGTDGRYMAVTWPLHGRYTPTTGVYWSRRRYSACHLTRVCTDRRAETAHGRGRHRLPVGCCSYVQP
jgi:hypothetical protein